MKKFNLKDAWRNKNPHKTQFTWRRKCSKIYRRLDYWLISQNLIDQDDITSCDIRPAILTDHQAISLKFGRVEIKRGPGYWKLNNSLLDNTDYQRSIINIIKQTQANETDLSPELLWELIKVNIKEVSIYYGKKINKEKNSIKENLQKHIK